MPLSLSRTQIYLPQYQQQSLSKSAKAAGTSTSALIREAIDLFLAQRQAAPSLAKQRVQLAGSWSATTPRVSIADLRREERVL
jgi:Ribbon-helix-helix protein, copG family